MLTSFIYAPQNVLPNVFTDDLSVVEILGKVVVQLNENIKQYNDLETETGDSITAFKNFINNAMTVFETSTNADITTFKNDINTAITAFENSTTTTVNNYIGLYNALKSFVDNYFATLDVQDEINSKLDIMKTDGTLAEVINEQIFDNLSTKIDNVGYSIKDFPLLEGEVDESLRIQRLINKAVQDKKKVILEPLMVYNCLTPLTLDLSYLDFDGNGSTLDFSNSTLVGSENCVKVICTNVPPYYNNHISTIHNVQIKGNKETGNTGLLFDYIGTGIGVSHLDIKNVNVVNFATGIKYLNHSYLIRHYSVDIWGCATCISMPTGGTDYGENISFFGCTLYNSTKCVYINNPNGCFNFTACSFDYSDAFFDCQAGRIFITNSHIEGSGTFTVSSANGNLVSLVNSWVILLQTDISAVKPFSVDGKLLFNSCFFGGFAFNSESGANAGTGIIEFNNSSAYNVAELSRLVTNTKNAKINKAIEVHTVEGTAVNYNRRNAPNASTSWNTTDMETGDKCLQFTKQYGGGSVSRLYLIVPIESILNNVRLRVKSSIADNNVLLAYEYVSLARMGDTKTANDGTSTYEIDKITQSEMIGATNQVLQNTWAWHNILLTSKVKPTWATHILVNVNFINSTACNVLFDRIELYEF